MAPTVPAVIFCLWCHAVLKVDTNSLDGYNASFSRTLLIRVRIWWILEVTTLQNWNQTNKRSSTHILREDSGKMLY
jgi:hypothetical protein